MSAPAPDRFLLVYRDGLLDDCVPFWLRHGLDREHGGVMTCLDREGRVLDTPLSESLFAGLAVGLGAQGFRPVVEYQFMGFIFPAIDQLLSHAGRLRTRTRGRLSCPIVVRAPYGGGIHAPEHHSESFEALFTHIPGLKVVIPGSPARSTTSWKIRSQPTPWNHWLNRPT